MSEKPPTTPTPEREKQKPLTPETAGQAKTSENAASVLSPENKSFFGRMSEGGRRVVSQVYEGLYKLPGVSRTVGKMEIAYNQFWIDRHQNRAIQFKEKINGLNSRVSILNQAKEKIESVIEDLEQQNTPGVESLRLKLQDIDRQKAGLLRDRDRAQSKFEAIDNKTKLYTNARDRIADRLIVRYEKKLEPMESELERLQTFNNQTDLLIAVAEAKYKEQLVRLGGSIRQIEESLRRTGMSEKEIRNFEAIKELKGRLVNAQKEKEALARRKSETNKRIAKVDAGANPYRDKREEFARVKEGRPIKIDVAVRQRGEVFTGKEEIKAHRRAETGYAKEPVLAGDKKESGVEEKSVEDKERLSTTAYINNWNTFLVETYKDDARPINVKDFISATGLSKDYKFDFKNFKSILGKYLKYKKLPVEQFNKSIDAFFEKKVKVVK